MDNLVEKHATACKNMPEKQFLMNIWDNKNRLQINEKAVLYINIIDK